MQLNTLIIFTSISIINRFLNNIKKFNILLFIRLYFNSFNNNVSIFMNSYFILNKIFDKHLANKIIKICKQNN